MSFTSDTSSTESLSSITSAISYLSRSRPVEYEEPQDAELFAAELKRRHYYFEHDKEQERRDEALNAWLQGEVLETYPKLLQAQVCMTPACDVETAECDQIIPKLVPANELARQNSLYREIRDFKLCWWSTPMPQSAVARLPLPFLTKQPNAIWM